MVNDNKKTLYFLSAFAGILLAVLGFAVSFRIAVFTAIFMLICIYIFYDYSRAVYVVALYAFVDYALREAVKIDILSNNWDELALIVFIILIGYKWLFEHKNPAETGIAHKIDLSGKISPLHAYLLFFTGSFVFLFIINSPNYSIALQGLRAIIQYCLWFFVVFHILKDQMNAKILLLIMVLTGTLMGLHGIYQYIIRVEIPASWIDVAESPVRTRVFSIVKSPNILGSLMVLLTPVSLSFAGACKKKWVKIFYMASFFAMFLCLVFTYSKMALFGFAACMAVYFFIKDKRLIFVPFIALLLVCIAVPSVGNRVAYLLSPEYIVSSLKGGRLLRWGIGIKLLQENLIFGVGLGHFGGAVAMNNNIPGTFYMDNYFLKTAVEGGLIGLVTFVALMFAILLSGARGLYKLKINRETELLNYCTGIYAGLFGVMIHNIVENVFEVPMMNTYFWLLAAVMLYMQFKLPGRVKEGIKKYV